MTPDSNTVEAHSGSNPTIERTLQPHGIAIREMEQVVEEPVLGVPHFVVVFPDPIHGVGDPEEVLKKPVGNLLIHGVVVCQNERDLQHVLAVESHPRRAVRLVQMAARRERSTAIKHANVVQPEKSTGENILSLRIFPVDPPVEILHQALKRPLQKAEIRPAQFFFNVVEKQSRPGMHWRIHVAEVPLVGRNLPIRMRIEIPQHEQKLILGKIEVHQR